MTPESAAPSRRRYRTMIAAGTAATAIFATGGAIAIADATAPPAVTRPAPQASPNFFCLAVGSLAFCLGPLTA